MAVLAFAGACAKPEPTQPTVAAPRPGDPVGKITGAIGFADGSSVDAITVEPLSVGPGDAVRVSFVVHEADDGGWVVGLRPPRDVSRQVARGGPDAPALEVPIDPRARFAELGVADVGSVELVLTSPWHARTAIATLERIMDGERIGVVSGARTASAIAMLGVVEVKPEPTRVSAVALFDGPMRIDGVLDEPVWAAAPRVGLVESLTGDPIPELPSTMAFVWDAEHLYVAAEFSDDDVWSDFRERDDELWKQEAFELFVFGDAGRANYLELQVSPRGVTFDARFERYRKGEFAWSSTWRTAVAVDGTLDDRSDVDRGWTVEAAVAWAEVCEHTSIECPVQAGRSLRLNGFRLERPRQGPPAGLALSPTKVPDFHAPENAAIVELEGEPR